jgi:sterol desaturase/sphingolipid hydroxylase (fatty acid hydroxylase superfamily)
MDWLVNTRAHPLDMVFTHYCGLFPIYVLGLAQPTGNGVDLVPLLLAIVGTVWSFVIHANVRWRFGCRCPAACDFTESKRARRHLWRLARVNAA